MPNKENPFLPDLNKNLADTKADIGTGLQDTQEEWLNQRSLPINLGIPKDSFGEGKKPSKEPQDNLLDLAKAIDSDYGKTTPADRASVSRGELPKDASRYPIYKMGEDNEESYAQKQGFTDKLWNGSVKALGTAAKVFVDGVVSPVVGAYKWAETGKFSAAYDNEWTRGLDEIQKQINDSHPNYATKAETNADWYSPSYWGSANFWTDKVLNNVGFLVGMAGVGGVVGRGLQLATEVMSLVPLLSRIATTEGYSEFIAESEKIAQNKTLSAVEKESASKELYARLNEKYADKFNVLNGGQRVAHSILSTTGMAQSQTLEVTNNFRNKLKEDYKNEHGKEADGEGLDGINNMTDALGKSIFALTLGMSAVSFHGILKKVVNPKEAEGLINEEINNLEIDEEASKLKGYRQYKSDEPGKLFNEESDNRFVKIGQKTANFGYKYANKIRKGYDVWGAAGFLEFGTINPAVENYYNKKYKDPNTDAISNILESVGVGINKGILSKEGFDAMILGGLGTGIPEYFSTIKGMKEKSERTNKVRDILNNLDDRESFLKDDFYKVKRAKAINDDLNQAIAEGDIEKQMSFRAEYAHNFIYPYIKHGLKGLLEDHFDRLEKLSKTVEGLTVLKNEGYINDFTEDDAQKTRESFQKTIKDRRELANKMEDNYKGLSLRYGAKRYPPEVVEKMSYLTTMADDAEKRIRDISKELTGKGIEDFQEDLRKMFSLIDSAHFHRGTELSSEPNKNQGKIRASIRKRIMDLKQDGVDVMPEEKEKLVKKFEDLWELYVGRKGYMAAYEDIKKDPLKYKDPVKATVIGQEPEIKPQEDKDKLKSFIKVKTKDNPDGEDLEIGEEYYAGTKSLPGDYDGKTVNYQEFSKFKVLGSTPLYKPDGSLLYNEIHIVTDKGQQLRIPEKEFAKYKLGKVSDVANNKKAAFFLDNINSVYEYNFGRGKKRKGRLEYSPKDGKLTFVYKEGNETRRMEVTSDQFVARDGFPDPKMKKISEIERLSPEEAEARKQREQDYFNSKMDEERQLKVAIAKLDTIDGLIKEKKNLLKDTEDKILEHEIKIEKAKKDLEELQKNFESYPQKENKGQMTKDTKKFLGSYIDTMSVLDNAIHDSEEALEGLYKNAEDLSFEIDYLNDMSENVIDLPVGKEFLEFFKDNIGFLEDVVLENGRQINKLSDFIENSKKYFSDLFDGLKVLINRFAKKNPEIGVDTENLEKAVEDLSGHVENILEYASYKNPDFVKSLWELKKEIEDYKEMSGILKESDIKNAMEEIADLYKEINEINKELKINRELYDTFNKKFNEWKKKEVKRKLFETKEARQGLASLQKSMNGETGHDEGFDSPEEEEKSEVKKEWESAKKDLIHGFVSSVDPSSDTMKETPFYRENDYWSKRHNVFLNGFDTMRENAEKGIVDPSSIKVVHITANNQQEYGFSFIPDEYSPFGESEKIDNRTNHEKGAIALVYVHEDAEGNLFTIDSEGKKLSKLEKGSEHDMSKAVYSYLENADLYGNGEFGKGDEKFTNKKDFDKEQVDEVLQKAKEARKALLETIGLTPRSFSVSRGIENVQMESYTDSDGETKQRVVVMDNPVASVFSGIETKIGTGVVFIPTMKTVDKDTADANNRLGYVTIGTKTIMMPLGRPFLRIGSTLVSLKTKKFSEGEAKHLFKTVLAAAENMLENFEKTGKFSVDPMYSQYLSSVAYFNDRNIKENPKRNQLAFDGQGNLILGKNKVKFTPESIKEHEMEIMTFFENAYHNVNNYRLSKIGKEPFYEIYGFDKQGNPQSRVWESYEHYLLSDKYELSKDHSDRDTYTRFHGKSRGDGFITPLSTDIVKTVDESGVPLKDSTGHNLTPTKQKYVSLDDYADLYPTVKKAPEKKPEEPAKPEEKQPKAEEPQTKETKEQAPAAKPKNYINDDNREEVGLNEQKGLIPDGETVFSFKTENGAIKAKFSYTVESTEEGLKYLPVVKEINGKIIGKDIPEDDPKIAIVQKNLIAPYLYKVVHENFEKIEETVETPSPVETIAPTAIEKVTDNNTSSVVEQEKVEEDEFQKRQKESNEKYKALQESAQKPSEEVPKAKNPFEERVVKDFSEPAISEDIESFKAYLKETTPGLEFEELPHLIRMGTGAFAWGIAKDNYIGVYTNAEIGTGFHEQFHGVWNSYLSTKEQQGIYDEFRKRKGSFTDREKGRTVSYGEATNGEIREAIAEEFREHRLTQKGDPYSPKKMSFFKRLINFIKKFVFGDPDKIKSLFEKIESSYYKNAEIIQRGNEGPEYSAMKGISEAAKKSIIEGWADMITRSFRKDHDLLVALCENRVGEIDIYHSLFNTLKDYYEGDVSKFTIYDMVAKGELTEGQAREALKLWSYMKDNKSLIEKDLAAYFKKHKITISENQEKELKNVKETDTAPSGEESKDLDVVDNTNQQDYASDILKLDMRDNTPKAIKLLFSFLTDMKDMGYNKDLANPTPVLGTAGLPVFVKTDKQFYKCADVLAGVRGLQAMESVMRDLAKTEPSLVNLVKSIFNKKENRTMGNVKVLLQFEKTFTKQKPLYLIHVMDEEGRSYTIDANLSKDTDLLIENWENALKGMYDPNNPKGLITLKDGYYSIDTKKLGTVPKDDKEAVKFLKEMGFDVDDNLFSKLENKSDREKLQNTIKDLFVQSKEEKNGQFKIIGKKAMDVGGHLNKLARLLVKAKGVSNPSQHLNIERESVSNHILPNYVSLVVDTLNASKSLEDFLSRVNGSQDVWRKNSRLLKRGGLLFDKDGKKKDFKIVPVIPEGLENGDERTPNHAMNKVMRHLQQFNLNLDGNYYNLIPADSKSEFGLQMGHYLEINGFVGNNYKNIAENVYKDYLAGEIDLIKDNVAGKRILTEKAVENDNYKKLMVFKDILSKPLVEKIHAYANGEGSDMDTETFVNSISKQFSEDFWNHIDKMTAKERDFLFSHEIISFADGGNYHFHGVNTDIAKEMGMNDFKDGKRVYTEEQIQKLLRFRLLNLMTHNIELKKVFFGPFYEIPDDPKRTKLFTSGAEATHVDMGDPNGINQDLNRLQNKVGEVTLSPGELGHHVYSDVLSALTMDWGDSEKTKIVSDNYGEIASVIGADLANAFQSINEMDAQGIMLDTYWREYQTKSGGAWSEQMEAQHQYDMAVARKRYYSEGYTNKDLEKADEEINAKGDPMLKGIGTPSKPKGAGLMEMDSQMIPFSIKDSIIRLSYPLAKERGMEDLYWFMHKNKIGLIGPKSHQKFGRLYNREAFGKEGLPSLYDLETGKFGLSKYSMDQINSVKFDIPYDHFGKIVNTTESHEDQTIGTQMRNLIAVDSFDNGVPVDYLPNMKLEDRIDRWLSIKDEAERMKSDRYRLWKTGDNALTALGNIGYENVKKDLGITEKDGKAIFADPKKLSDFLHSEISKRDMADNILDAVKTEMDPETGKERFVMHLEASPFYLQLKQMIWSKVAGEIIRPKVNGKPCILVSSTLFEKNGREAVYKPNGDKSAKWSKVEDFSKLSDKEKETVRLSSSKLKFYKRGEKKADGTYAKTELMQVHLPNIFHDKLKKSGVKVSEEKMHEYLSSEEGKAILKGIGFRIPTQGLNSMEAFEIAPWSDKEFFMPITMGDSIIVPSEITAKVGSDYDIDKMNTYLRNTYIDKKGFPRLVVFHEDTNSIGNLRDVYERKYTENQRALSGGEFAEELMTGESVEKTPSLEQFIKENKGKDPFMVNTREAIENKYFDTLEETLMHQDNYARLVTPNSSDEMLAIEKKLSEILSPAEKGRGKKDINYANLLDPMYLTEIRQLFLDSKNLVGISASNNTSHAMSQLNPIYLNDEAQLSDKDRQWAKNVNILLKHPKVKVYGKERTSLSNLKDSVGSFISDKISQYINGSVDAANDPWLMRMLQNPDLMGIAMFLDRTGASVEDVFMFINQPSIQAYIREKAIYKAKKGIVTDAEPVYDTEMVENVKSKYLTPSYPPRDKEFTTKELTDMLKKHVNNEEFTKGEMVTQKQILDEFMKYRVFADHLFKVQAGTSWSNFNKPNDISVTLKEMALDYANKQNVISSADKIMGNTFNNNIKDKVIKARDGMEGFFKTKSAYVQKQLAPIMKLFGNPELMVKGGVERKKAIIEQAHAAIIDYAIQNFVKINGKEINSYLNALFVDEKTNISKMLREIQSMAKGDLEKNLALQGLKAVYRMKSTDAKTIEFRDRPKDGFTSNGFTESLRELRDNGITQRLYNNLLVLGMLQNGIRDGRTQFLKYMPVEDLAKLIAPAMDHLDDDLEGFMKNLAFFRNNVHKDDIVPLAKKVNTGIINPYGDEIKGYPYFINTSLNDLSPDQKSFLSLHSESANAKYPVVKTRIIGTNEKGELYSKEEIKSMRAKGDYSYFETRAYKRVETPTGEFDKYGNEIMKPVVVGRDQFGKEKWLYKQINVWGDRDMQEYYDDVRQSILAKNIKVDEVEDVVLANALKGRINVDTVPSPKANNPANLEDKGNDVKNPCNPII